MIDEDEPALTPEAEATLYRPIKKLDESVVNRIAAGEIIHRPANALKELIENSLDAGANIIRITLKEGGIKMLQIQDNGCGIQPSDLPLLCERFATSKLRQFEDLQNMSTFGFRGEALASISYVTASLNVVSKTKHQDCAYKAFYANGALAPPKPGQSSDPKQCAGTDGTLITAEDLFYNVPQRRRALKSASDEYNRALDVVTKYAVHYGGRGIGFVCRKAGSNVTDLNAPSSPTNTTLDTIRLLHGNAVARELVELASFRHDRLGFTCQGWVSGANWSAKRTTMLCFINNRLVDCPLLKRSMEALYSTLLPKGGHPWIYLSLVIDPANVDVNVHPTKKEVHFLNEDEIVEEICQAVQSKLADANSSRTFKFSQAVLPVLPKDSGSVTHSQLSSAHDRNDQESNGIRPALSENRDNSSSSSSDGGHTKGPISASRGYPQHLVRVDARTRTLDSMFSATSETQSRPLASDSAVAEGKKRAHDLEIEESASSESLQTVLMDASSSAAASSSTTRQAKRGKMGVRILNSECSLTSVRHLREHIVKSQHRNLTDIVQNHTFVGVVDLERGLSLLQHETKLLLVNHDAFIEEFSYQLVLRQFGSLKSIKLEPPPSISELVELGLEMLPEADEAEKVDTNKAKDRIVDLLVDHAEMLEEYFSFIINTSAKTIDALPSLLPGHKSGSGIDSCAINLDRLPQLLVRLATRVNWQDEQECFDTFARQLAWSCLPSVPVEVNKAPPAEEGDRAGDTDGDDQDPSDTRASKIESEAHAEAEQTRRRIQHLWFDNMAKSRGRYVPSKGTNKYVLQVAKLPDLYRVFERC